MATVRMLRRAFAVVFVLLALVAVAAAALLLSPWGARGKRELEAKRVHQQLLQKRLSATPLEHIDQKIAEAQKQIQAFYSDRLPQRDSAVAEELGKLTQEAGVRFSGIRIADEATDLPNLDRLTLDVSLAGDYLRIVKFVNELERDHMFFIVDRVNLAEQQGGNVRLELRLETYLRLA